MNNNNLIKALRAERDELAKQLEAIDSLLQSYLNRDVQESDLPKVKTIKSIDDYDKGWSAKNKVAYIIKQKNRFLHIREIAKFFLDYEESKDDISSAISKIRLQLTILKKDKSVISVKADNQLRNSFWGSPKWLDKNGKIKEGYEYDPALVKKDSPIDIE